MVINKVRFENFSKLLKHSQSDNCVIFVGEPYFVLKVIFIDKFLNVLYGTCIGLLITTNSVYSQNLFTNKLLLSDGLLGYDNYKISCSKKGDVWISSENGIVRFSYGKYQHFTSKNGLKTNDVWDMTEDTHGRMWLNSFASGCQYIEDGKVKTLMPAESFQDIAFVGEHNDTLFFNAFENGNFMRRYYLTSNFKSFGHYNLFTNKGFEVIGDFRDFGFFILMDQRDQLFTYQMGSGKRELIYKKGHYYSLGQRYVVDDSKYIVTANNALNVGLYEVVHGGLKLVDNRAILEVDYRDINFIAGDNILVKRSDRIDVYSDIERDIHNLHIEKILKEQFANKNVWDLCFDHDNNIWVVEKRGGISFCHKSVNWTRRLSTRGFEVNELTETLNQLIYKDFLLFRTGGNQIGYFNPTTEQIEYLFSWDRSIRQIGIYGDNLIILESKHFYCIPLSVKDNKLITSLNLKKTFELQSLGYSFTFLNRNSILFGNGECYDFVNQTWNPMLPGFKPAHRTEEILQVNSFIVYRNTSEIGYYDIRTKELKELKIVGANCIREIDGRIYIGTLGHGLYVYDAKNFKFLFQNDIALDIVNIQKIDSHFYISTFNGMIVANLKANDQFKVYFTFWNQTQFGVKINSVYVNDMLYALTNQGVICLNIKEFAKFSLPFLFTLEGTKGNGKKLFKNERVDYGINGINFKIVPNTFFSANNLVYRYKLVGFNKEWIYTTNLNLPFHNLRSGKYVLKVQSAIHPNADFSNLNVFKFQVGLPTYQQRSFIVLLIVLFLVSSLFVGWIFRLLSLRKEKRQLRLIELEYQALQAQLNPHFVFNSLNSIQNMIFAEDKLAANDYICSFADLMRKILDSSKQKRITLADELSIIENYLKIEKTRIGDSFIYSIENDIEAPLNRVGVYGMVFQPILENAIVHAFITNQHEKNLRVEIKIENNILVGTVTDNGVGRISTLNKERRGMYKSWSSTILKEKLELLNYISKDELHVNIIDLYDENQNPVGTKVVVRMKIIFI